MEGLTGIVTTLNAVATIAAFVVAGNAFPTTTESVLSEETFGVGAAFAAGAVALLATIVTWAVLHSLTQPLRAAADQSQG